MNNEQALKSVAKKTEIRAFYKITSEEIGTVVLRRRKIAKALRWWLRENGFEYRHTYFFN